MIKKIACLVVASSLMTVGNAWAQDTSTSENATPPQEKHISNKAKNDADIKVNVNTASSEDLQKLPRIGKKLADRIIDYRQAHGPFKSFDDLGHVKGVSKKMLDNLQVNVTFS